MKKLIIASDLHLSAAWDKISEAVPVAHKVLNPNTLFKETVAKLTPEDSLVMNGDIVDYNVSDYEGKGKKSNWDILFDTLKNLKSSYYINLGNHDFRKIAYNHRFFKSEQINLKKEIAVRYEKFIGHRRFRFLKELQSLLGNVNPIKKYALQEYYSALQPGIKLIFLNTGSEAVLQLKNFINLYVSWIFFKNFIQNIENPILHGLTKTQIKFLKHELTVSEEKENYIFLHCPPFFSKIKTEPVKLNLKNSIDYFRGLHNNKLCYGFFLRNNRSFIRSVCESDKNITVVTSHIHEQKNYLLHKKQYIITECSLEKTNEMRHDPDYIKFIATPSLGMLGPFSKKIGYMEVTAQEIKNHTVLDLKNEPQDIDTF